MIYLDYRSPGFTGVHRLHPRKIVLMILFGFEVKKVPNKIIFLICFESKFSPGGQPWDCLARATRPGPSKTFWAILASYIGGPNFPRGGDGDPQGDEKAADLGEGQVHREVQLRQCHQGWPCRRGWPLGCFKNGFFSMNYMKMKMGRFWPKVPIFRCPKNGTLSTWIQKQRPLFNANIPPKRWNEH